MKIRIFATNSMGTPRLRARTVRGIVGTKTAKFSNTAAQRGGNSGGCLGVEVIALLKSNRVSVGALAAVYAELAALLLLIADGKCPLQSCGAVSYSCLVDPLVCSCGE